MEGWGVAERRRIKDSLHTVRRVKGRPRSLVPGTVFSHGSLAPNHVEKEKGGKGMGGGGVCGEALTNPHPLIPST